MTEAALRLVAAEMSADAEFDRWVGADPARALRDFEVTAEEHDRLLRIDIHRDNATKYLGGETK